MYISAAVSAYASSNSEEVPTLFGDVKIRSSRSLVIIYSPFDDTPFGAARIGHMPSRCTCTPRRRAHSPEDKNNAG